MVRCLRRQGMTLIEIVVVLAIVGTLIALLLPLLQACRESARRTQCVNHLKQIGIGFHMYSVVHSRVPGGNSGPWTGAILNDIGYADAASLVPAGNPSAASLLTAGRVEIGVFMCPSQPRIVFDDGQIASNVIANSRTQAMALAAFSDGLSTTILATDNKSSDGFLWPAGPTGDAGSLVGGIHRGSRPVLIGDGGVRLLQKSVSDEVRQALMTPAGGELNDNPY